MKRALISVYHKEKIDDIAAALHKAGWEIISTGGTAAYLKDKGIPVSEVSGITRFPEILDGRVKTLHPLIFGPVLAKKTAGHLRQLEEFKAPKIDLVDHQFLSLRGRPGKKVRRPGCHAGEHRHRRAGPGPRRGQEFQGHHRPDR